MVRPRCNVLGNSHTCIHNFHLSFYMNTPPTRPTAEEAQADLNAVRVEMQAMQLIKDNAEFLSVRPDVDGRSYKTIAFKSGNDIERARHVEQLILERYPALK